MTMFREQWMASFTDALRDYAYKIHKRDGFRCQFCGLDGSTWPNWLSLSVDHLLPKRHPLRDEDDFIVTACMFCDTADNQYFRHAEKRGLKFDEMTPQELIQQCKPYVGKVRSDYKEFLDRNVRGQS